MWEYPLLIRLFSSPQPVFLDLILRPRFSLQLSSALLTYLELWMTTGEIVRLLAPLFPLYFPQKKGQPDTTELRLSLT